MEQIEDYAAKMLGISSHVCSGMAAIPISYGIPNCLAVNPAKNVVVVGTTNG